jgi:hypothetical protein
MESALGLIGGALGLLALFGGLALIIWVGANAEVKKKQLRQAQEMKEREYQHAERLKALEAGLPLPDGDLAAARAEGMRAWAAALVGIVVPPAVFGISLGASAVILGKSLPGTSVPVLCVLWAAAGVTSVVAVVMSTSAVMGRGRRWAERGTPTRDAQPVGDRATTAITERVPSMRI